MKTEEQRKKHNEYMKKYMKEYRKKNPDKIHKMKNGLQRAWRAKNRDKTAKYDKDWYLKNPEKIKLKGRKRTLKQYGLTLEQYDAMLQNQGGVCAVCGLTRGTRRMAVDHDHKTNKVRGLLCQFCNTALGKFLDSVEILKRAISYLEKQGAPV